MGNFEPAKFIPFHFVKLASLTSLVKDKVILYTSSDDVIFVFYYMNGIT